MHIEKLIRVGYRTLEVINFKDRGVWLSDFKVTGFMNSKDDYGIIDFIELEKRQYGYRFLEFIDFIELEKRQYGYRLQSL